MSAINVLFTRTYDGDYIADFSCNESDMPKNMTFEYSVIQESELAQLRATIAEQAAQIESLQMQAALLDDYAETVRMHEITIEAQAAQIASARVLIQTAKDYYQEDLINGIDSYDKGAACIEWLEANPAQEVK